MVGSCAESGPRPSSIWVLTNNVEQASGCYDLEYCESGGRPEVKEHPMLLVDFPSRFGMKWEGFLLAGDSRVYRQSICSHREHSMITTRA